MGDVVLHATDFGLQGLPQLSIARLLQSGGSGGNAGGTDCLKRAIGVMSKLLGPGSVELVDVRNLDWSEKGAEACVREFVQTGPRIDALWAANDPMAFGAITACARPDISPALT